MDKVRLLILIDEMEAGGSQRQIVALANSLDASRFNVTVAYFRNESFLLQDLNSSKAKVVKILKRARFDPLFIYNFSCFLRKGQFDLVHAFSFSAEFWASLLFFLRPGPVLVTSIRGVYEWYGPFQWKVKKWVTSRSQAVVSNSEAGRLYASDRMGAYSDRIHVIPNGLAPEKPVVEKSEVRGALGIGDSTSLILFVGRLVNDKNVGCLVRAAETLKQRNGDFHIVIVGDGELRLSLEENVDRNGLAGHISFLGERRDVADIMNASDIVVLPSFREGLSNVLLEAMSLGKPVIASAVGGNKELVNDNLDGLLFSSDDHQALARLILKLIDNPALGERLGAAARDKVAANYSLKAMAEGVSRIYRDVIAGKSRKAKGQGTGQHSEASEP